MSWLNLYLLFSASPKRFPPLQMVQIYFDTATYDEIERDVKNSLEDQLGLLGGTLGLFTGFSILSGVEIIFYLGKIFLVHSRIRRTWCGHNWFFLDLSHCCSIYKIICMVLCSFFNIKISLKGEWVQTWLLCFSVRILALDTPNVLINYNRKCINTFVQFFELDSRQQQQPHAPKEIRSTNYLIVSRGK